MATAAAKKPPAKKPTAKKPKAKKPTRTRSSGKRRPAEIQKLQAGKRNIHILLYGDPGSEKTRTAGTSPNALLLNADGTSGPDSIMHRDIDVWNLEDLYEAQTAMEFLRRQGHKEYEWVWLDGITLLQEKQMDKVLADIVAVKSHRDPDIADVKEYLKVQNQLKRLVRDLIGLDMHVGITAHSLRVEDDDDGTVQYWPAITGKLMPQKISGYMGIVAYMGRQKIKRRDEMVEVTTLRAQSTDKFYGKDRYGALTKPIANPTIPKITKLVTDAVSGGKE